MIGPVNMNLDGIIKIAIIGVGPRGLTVLERIVAQEQIDKTSNINILVFDSNVPGVGCHHLNQADHLLLNTVASQITIFSDESVKNAGYVLNGPSFYDWLIEHGHNCRIKIPDPNAYYPRKIFGRYLNWCYQYLLSKLPRHVSLKYIKSNIVNLDLLDDSKIDLTDDENNHYICDYVFITTGHTPKKTGDEMVAVIENVYPIREKLQHINNHTVAIEGWGLTAFDLISELSVGRNGKFNRDLDGILTYQKSGKEPKIHIFSRSGIPLLARAYNQKSVSEQYKPRFFTYDYIDGLRLTQQHINFEADILPALITEMEYVYYKTYFKNNGLEFDKYFETVSDYKISQNVIDSLLCLIPAKDIFSWNYLVNPVPHEVLACAEQFEAWLDIFLKLDVQEAYMGNLSSPIKAANDVLRDVRDILRYSINFGGMTEHSHRKLYNHFVPIMNRLAVGPPKERIEEVRALKKSGVIVAYHVPGTRAIFENGQIFLRSNNSNNSRHSHKVDYLLRARISIHSPAEDNSALIQNLLQKRLIKLYYNGVFHPGGITVTKQFNLIKSNDEIIDNLYALGMLVDGINFYTFIVPRPGVNSTVISDAGTSVLDMLKKIASNQKGNNE